MQHYNLTLNDVDFQRMWLKIAFVEIIYEDFVCRKYFSHISGLGDCTHFNLGTFPAILAFSKVLWFRKNDCQTSAIAKIVDNFNID